MRMDGRRQFLSGAFQLHGRGSFRDHVCRVYAVHVYADDLAVFRLCDDLDEPALLALGISYHPDRPADVFVACPVADLPTTPMNITRTVAAEMQAAVDGAVAAGASGQRTPSR